MNVAAAGDESPKPPDAGTGPSTLPAAADLEAQRKAVAENTAIDEATRTRIDELYGKAITRIADTTANEQQRQQLAAELGAASEQLAEVQQRLEGFSPTRTEQLTAEQTDSETVSALLTDARAQVTTRRTALDAVADEIARRAARRTQLPVLKSETQQSLDSVEKELAATAPPDEPAELTSARRTLLLLRKRYLQSQLALVEQESQTYEPTVRLWSAQRDLAERQLRDAERVAAALQDRLSEVRRQEAQTAAQEARTAAANAHPAVADVADRNSTLAEENQSILLALEQTRRLISDSTELRDALKADFESLQRRAEAAGFSQAIGVLLRSQRNRLPDTSPYVVRAQERAPVIASAHLKLIEWETERNELVDPDDAVQQLLPSLAGSLTESELDGVAVELAAMLSQTKQLLSTAIENGSLYLDRLVALDSLERELIQEAEAQSAYIAEHVLWVKSAEPVRLATLRNAWTDAARLITRPTWQEASRVLFADLGRRPLKWGIFSVVFLWMLLTRGRLRASIREDGTVAARSSATSIRPTLRATVNSAILAGLCPGVIWLCGSGLSSPAAGGLFRSIGDALRSTAVIWFGLEFLRQLIRSGGVCELHFGWPQNSLRTVRRWLRTTMLLTIPACWILLICEEQENETLHSGLGRLAFVFATVVLTAVLFQLLRGHGAIARDIAAHKTGNLWSRSRPFWATAAIAAPATLAVLSLAGFQYSALQMSRRFLITNALVAGLVVVYCILNRWLLVTYRRIAIMRSRQRREALLVESAEQGGEAGRPVVPEPDAVPEVSLADVNQQTRKLIRLGVGVGAALGLWFVWIDVLPALGILRSFELWPSQIAWGSGDGDGELAPHVTLADLVLAIGCALLTMIAVRNIPGLMEITVLQKLPIDAGARYAASSLTRYIIAVIGVTLSFRLIGVGWSSVQWLIAAMTVGLGFGLQEIFANFVSGLILLFERPVRIGDTVTVNDITGTVSRIRIRATTILDWDNKELIVPNRAFVTDNLINWTLTSPDLRMILRVGIAYGSNTRLATELLRKVARDNPKVLNDPEPVVIFQEFGESSLNFEMRIFVTGLQAYRSLQHELNLAIDDEFRKAGIEIAFPQRDLHLRSIPAELAQLQGSNTESSALRVAASED